MHDVGAAAAAAAHSFNVPSWCTRRTWRSRYGPRADVLQRSPATPTQKSRLMSIGWPPPNGEVDRINNGNGGIGDPAYCWGEEERGWVAEVWGRIGVKVLSDAASDCMCARPSSVPIACCAL